MTQLALQLPITGQPNSTEDTKVASNFTAIQAAVNGGLDTANLSPTAGILVSQLNLAAATPTALTYSNSWVDYGLAYQTGSYIKDALGWVHLRGLVKKASAWTVETIATLPASYRPATSEVFTCFGQDGSAANVIAQINITALGVVQITNTVPAVGFGLNPASMGFLSLSGISFLQVN